VKRVVQIHYPDCNWETAFLCAEIELDGKSALRWYGYQDLMKESGGKEAVERFKPQQ
jgi:hypothetical protein